MCFFYVCPSQYRHATTLIRGIFDSAAKVKDDKTRLPFKRALAERPQLIAQIDNQLLG